MTRKELENYISEVYDVEPDYPWFDANAVFRHKGNRKWFALAMEIPKDRLIQDEPGMVDVVNLKAMKVDEPGVYPAYHMNKYHWVSVALDGSASDDTVKMLLEISFEATRGKKK